MSSKEVDAQLRELMRSFVMEAIANDYEDLSMIESEVTDWAAEHKLAVTQNEIRAILVSLIESGLAKAYLLGSQPEFTAEPMAGSGISDPGCYFLLTAEGREALDTVVERCCIVIASAAEGSVASTCGRRGLLRARCRRPGASRRWRGRGWFWL